MPGDVVPRRRQLTKSGARGACKGAGGTDRAVGLLILGIVRPRGARGGFATVARKPRVAFQALGALTVRALRARGLDATIAGKPSVTRLTDGAIPVTVRASTAKLGGHVW